MGFLLDIPCFWRKILMLFGCVLLTAIMGFAFVRNLFVGADVGAVGLFSGFLFLGLSLLGAFRLISYFLGYFILTRERRRNRADEAGRRCAAAGLEGRAALPGRRSGKPLMVPDVSAKSAPSAVQQHRPTRRMIGTDAPCQQITTRTAMVMPVCHEDVDRVADGIRTIWRSALRNGLDRHCDYFILSDSTDAEVIEQENDAYESLLSEFAFNRNSSGRLFLVRRKDHGDFKAGNIGNFLENHGEEYDFILVLDADSIMLGARIRKMILRMQDSPRTGILQGMVLPIRGMTPFARIWNFALWRTAPLIVIGISWVLGRDPVYWGHNALIRIKPFMEHCLLPILPGEKPFGGRIMSHDFVEAALMRRGGWGVDWDREMDGSFDEIPANPISYAKRDHRWCQGNFQLFWLIFGEGIKPCHRFYFGYAIMTFGISLLMAAMMVFGFIYCVIENSQERQTFVPWLIVLNFPVLQLIPKLLGLTYWWDGSKSWSRQIIGTIADIPITSFIYPLLFFQHCKFVLSILARRTVTWECQSRNPNDEITWSLALNKFWVPTLIALLWIPAAIWLAPNFIVYAFIILAGWLFSIPIAVLSSNARLGDWLMRTGIFELPISRENRKEMEAAGLLGQPVPAGRFRGVPLSPVRKGSV